MRWKPAHIRLWEGVDQDSLLLSDSKDSCWNWTKSKNDEGYGKFRLDKHNCLAHRYSYLLHYGELPNNLLVLHTCDNPSCVNPKHLFLGTDKDNSNDRDAKGRNIAHCGEKNGNSKLTECDIREIRLLDEYRWSQVQIAKQFDISRRLVRIIIKREIWKHVS